MKKTLSILVAIIAFVAVAFPAFASSLPVGGSQYYLSGAGINATQTTIQLTALKTPDGRNITMAMFGTVGYGALEPQTTAKIEDISFTGIVQNANGTATLTGVTRGEDFVYPYTSTASLEKSHSGGATFIITNTAGFYYNEFAMPNNANVNTWPFASTSPATKGYVDYVAFNGAAVINANTINKGIVQIATAAQAAASNGIGSTGATLVVPASIATSTYNAATAANVIPVTKLTGILDSGFVYPTTTVWPNTNGASTTVLTNNGSGTLSWIMPSNRTLAVSTVASSTSSTATTSMYTIPLPASTINGTSKILRLSLAFGSFNNGNACVAGIDFGTGAATTSVSYFSLPGTVPSSAIVNLIATSSASEVFITQGQTTRNILSGGYATVNLANQSYISVNVENAGGGGGTPSCQLNGISSELLSAP